MERIEIRNDGGRSDICRDAVALRFPADRIKGERFHSACGQDVFCLSGKEGDSCIPFDFCKAGKPDVCIDFFRQQSFFFFAVHRGKTAGCHDLAFSAGMISTARHGKICFAVMQNISDRDNFPIFPLYHLLVCLYFHQTHLNHGSFWKLLLVILISKDNSVIKTITLYKNLKNKAITILAFLVL